MNHEFVPIRKVIDGINVNTDTAHSFYTETKVVSEVVNDEVVHRYMAQGLYQVRPDGPYFLAFWNRLQWDNKTLKFSYIDDAILIKIEQAKQWMNEYCPTKYNDFIENIGQVGKASNAIVAVNLRMPVELRANLMSRADLSGSSFNKICINLINEGLNSARTNVVLHAPSWAPICMPDGTPALNGLQRANKFDDPDDQALANDAEKLYWHCREQPTLMLPFALQVLHRLFHINRDEKRAFCFALWLSVFHRNTFEDNEEYRRRNPNQREYGEWRWVKIDYSPNTNRFTS